MQAASLSIQPARPRQKSCTECRRRRQKCNPRKDGPCEHCVRRYPPVQCIMPEQPLRTPKIESEVNFSDVQERKGSNFKSELPAINERLQASPYPSLSGRRRSSQDPQRNSLLEVESGSSSAFNSSPLSHFLTDRDSYLEILMDSKTEKSVPSLSILNSDTVVVRRGFTGSPENAFGGIVAAISSLNGLPIEPTLRNAELFQLFHQCVIPNLVSLDGQGTIPALFRQEMLPWMIQSPLMPNIAVLMASYTQALDQGLQVVKHSEPLSIKAHVLSLINQFLKHDFDAVGGEALRAVIHLVIMEWFWGAEVSLWAHMKGIKQMIHLRGGFEGMRDPLLVQVLILTDYELACCYERDLYLQPSPSVDEELLIPISYPDRYSGPLLDFPAPFQLTRQRLNLNLETAQILDEVRGLTLSITSHSSPKMTTSKIQSTAKLIHEQMLNLRLKVSRGADSESMFDTIRLAAIIYTSCILSLKAFCSLRNNPLIEKLYLTLSQVSLNRWKEIPGVFLWILLIAAPSSGNDIRGRFLKKKMAVAGMSIGLEDFNLATGHLRAFWKVQRWIARSAKALK